MADGLTHSPGDWMAAALTRYESPLLRYAARLTGSLDAARDVVQDTFMKLLWQDRAKLNGNEAAWLFTVCRNLAFDARRRNGRSAAVMRELSMPPRSPAPDAQISAGEESRRVLALLSRLPEHQQDVVLLRFQCGLSYRQIAEVTGLSVGNVGYLLHTALRTLRERLEESEALGKREAPRA